MEPWLQPLYDAEGSSRDRWLGDRGARDTLRAADGDGGHGAGRGGGLALAAGPGADRLRQGEQRRRRAGRGPASAPDWASRSRRSSSGRDEVPTDLDAWLAGSGAVVDAIFGTGFSGAPREPASAAIDAINRCGAPVVACDIASGVDASSGEIAGAAVEADLTVSFHAAKLGQRIAPGKWHTGELRVVPIGIPAGAPGEPAGGVDRRPPSSPCCRAAVPRSTKFSSGQVAIAGGSRGLTGAVRMSSLAAIRAGAGYATVAVPADLEPVFEAGEPEVMSVGCPGGDGCLVPASAKAVLRAFERAAAGVLGPGMGRDPGSVELAREVVGAIEAPLVIDADGLNAFAEHLGPVAAREAPTVLTPARRRARAPARPRLGGDRRPPARLRPRGRPGRRRDRRPQGRRHDRQRRRAGRGQRDLRPGPGHRRQRRRPLRDPRGAARPRPGAVRGRLRGGRRPRPRRPRRRRPHRRRRVGDRQRRDRLDPGGPARRRAGRIISPGMKTAAEIMNADVPSVSPDDDARAAIDLLAKTDMGAVAVVDEDRQAWSASSASRT